MSIRNTLKTLVVSVVYGLALLVAACTPAQPSPTATPQAQEPVVITISGSGSVTTVLTALETAFEAATPGYNLNILSGSGTSAAVASVLDGTLDVAAMVRAPREEETAGGLLYTSFGQTGVAILVHPDVEVTNLNQEQVNAIFFGEITNWSEVGGQDLPIIVFVRDEDDSATGLLRDALFGETPFPETAQVMTSAGDMATALEGTPGAVGFGSWSSVVTRSANVEAVMLDNVAPTDPAYPFILPLGLGYSEAHLETVQPLLDWLLSEEGQSALLELGTISLEA